MLCKTTLFYLSLLTLSIGTQGSLAKELTPKYQSVLNSDGPNNGLDSYALIRKEYGRKAIESPDL